MRRGPVRAAVVAVVLAATTSGRVTPASPSHLDEVGFVHTGVPHEDAAREYDCENEEGGWDRTGPVVCVAKHADVYSVYIETNDADCHRRGDSWEGTCVFDIDMDDHVRVWGITGVPYTRFVVEFGHGTGAGNGGKPATARPTTSTTRPRGAGSPPSPTTTTPPTPSTTSTTSAMPAAPAENGTTTTADSTDEDSESDEGEREVAAESSTDAGDDDTAVPVVILVAVLTALGASAIALSRWRTRHLI